MRGAQVVSRVSRILKIVSEHPGGASSSAVAAAAGVATLEVIAEENLVDNARVRGDQMLQGLTELAPKFGEIGNVRGLGLMAGIEFVDATGAPDAAAAAAVQQACIPERLLTLTCGPMGNVVRLIPALVVTEDEIATGLNRFEAALTATLG